VHLRSRSLSAESLTPIPSAPPPPPPEIGECRGPAHAGSLAVPPPPIVLEKSGFIPPLLNTGQINGPRHVIYGPGPNVKCEFCMRGAPPSRCAPRC